MKTFFAVLTFFALSIVTVLAQSDTLNQVDEDGLKQGYWIGKYANGNKKYEGSFKNNKPIGKLIRYNDDGDKKAEIIFNETDSAYTKLYYPSGTLASEGFYLHTKKQGEWRYYSYYSQELSAIENFKDDIKHGRSLTYYDAGNIAEEFNYTNGIKNGTWKQFYESGNLKLNAIYTNNELNGKYTLYYENRLKYIEGTYVNGKMDGLWYYFNPEGQIDFKAKYKNGELLNANELEEKQQQFFEDIEKNKGKFNDPTIEDLMPMQ